MTFDEWYQGYLDHCTELDSSCPGLRAQVLADREVMEVAWDAAMVEAAEICIEAAKSAGRQLDKMDESGSLEGYQDKEVELRTADCLARRIRVHLTSGLSPAPQQEEPGAGTDASGAPVPGPQQAPGPESSPSK